MKIISLIVDDMRHLMSTIVSTIILIGLVAIPSLFAWFNIAASWDPFKNMNAMKFAVVNNDRGYQSDLLPLKIRMGDQIVSSLHANSDLDWTFTSRNDALDGVRSGHYYAALVIPEDFSENMMSFFTSDSHHAHIIYYSNEKKNAVAPNLTHAVADEVAEQLNEIFVQSLVEHSLDIIKAIAEQIDQPNSRDFFSALLVRIDRSAHRLDQISTSLHDYDGLLESCDHLLASSSDLVTSMNTTASISRHHIDMSGTKIDHSIQNLHSYIDHLHQGLDSSLEAITSLNSDIDRVLDDATAHKEEAIEYLNHSADIVQRHRADYSDLRNHLAAILGDEHHVVARMDSIISSLDSIEQRLRSISAKIANDDPSTHENLNDLSERIRTDIDSAHRQIDTSLYPSVDNLRTSIDGLKDQLLIQLDSAADTTSQVVTMNDSLRSTIDHVRTDMAQSSEDLRQAAHDLHELHQQLDTALSTHDPSHIVHSIDDSGLIARSIAAPVTLKRHSIFPVNNFGSGVAPYYTFIPLWTASILISLTIKTSVSSAQRKRLGGLSSAQAFLGRFATFAVISLLQSTVSTFGSLYIIKVQAVHPFLFMLSGWIAGLVFSLFIYTMVATFGNIGKAIGMLMLVFQVSSSTGTYPLQVLPPFFQTISPFLPITHAIAAMRSAIAGIYQADYWWHMAALASFIPPLLIIGLAIRPPLISMQKRLHHQLQSTRLIG